MPPSQPLPEGTKARALHEAKALLQTVGFNGFSFQHIADRLGIKKPSLYDHFASKEELGVSLIEDYRQSLEQWQETIEIFEPGDKVGALFEMFVRFASKSGRCCPLSVMIADYHTLPPRVKRALSKMYLFQRDWLTEVIQEGKKKKAFRSSVPEQELAEILLSMGLGAQLIARISGDAEKIRSVKIQALRLLEAK